MNHAEKIKSFFENLSIEDLSIMNEIYEEDAFFKDPFNELRSIKMIRKIFVEMFEKLDRPHFKFLNEISSEDQLFLTWDFIFSKGGKEYSIHGCSHLKLTSAGKITYHRDYWDVGEELLLKIPVIKNLYGILRNRLSVDS